MPWIPLAPALGILGLLMAFGIHRYVRAQPAAKTIGRDKAPSVPFYGGSVMGLPIASLGLVGLGIFYWVFRDPLVINGFAMGASSIALFARVGGGIYTKSADVGADLVGKVEAGIPEDDP